MFWKRKRKRKPVDRYEQLEPRFRKHFDAWQPYYEIIFAPEWMRPSDIVHWNKFCRVVIEPELESRNYRFMRLQSRGTGSGGYSGATILAVREAFSSD